MIWYVMTVYEITGIHLTTYTHPPAIILTSMMLVRG